METARTLRLDYLALADFTHMSFKFSLEATPNQKLKENMT